MYYVIEQSYEGPNLDQHPDDHTIRVQTSPGRGNMNHEPIISGWLGTTNDWCEIAHGEYGTLDEAIRAIDGLADGNHRVDDLDIQDRMERGFYRVRVGRLKPLSAADSQDFCWEDMRNQIGGDATDNDISEWADECARFAEDEGALLDTDAVIRMATQYRDEKADALAEDDVEFGDDETTDDPDNRHYAAGYSYAAGYHD